MAVDQLFSRAAHLGSHRDVHDARNALRYEWTDSRQELEGQRSNTQQPQVIVQLGTRTSAARSTNHLAVV